MIAEARQETKQMSREEIVKLLEQREYIIAKGKIFLPDNNFGGFIYDKIYDVQVRVVYDMLDNIHLIEKKAKLYEDCLELNIKVSEELQPSSYSFPPIGIRKVKDALVRLIEPRAQQR